MAITATMSQDENKDHHDQHEADMVMPGFRFHPTEEELIEFYLRRKVEGKRFNVELITFLDLYRYDPWELPALAAIGEKEWFFYVPRDRKYRNGDRPNRVTTSGYWKATGADRMIRSESSKPIGLKKTLVFYSGKAPKGVRTSWIMNEYRLPHHETERLQKAEISLCRVYKRAGVEDPRPLPQRPSSSRVTPPEKNPEGGVTEKFQALGGHNSQLEDTEKMSETSGSSSTDMGLAPKPGANYIGFTPLPSPAPAEDDRVLLHSDKQTFSLEPAFAGTSLVPQNPIDDLHRLVNFQQIQTSNSSIGPQQHQLYHIPQLPPLPPPAAFSDRLWEWNIPAPEGSKDYGNPFKESL
ncbi:hypothetical protein NMG60_11036605 [Bertholletia excelsa]